MTWLHLWNDTKNETHKYSGKTVSQCHFVHHKSHKDRPQIESGPPLRKALSTSRYLSLLPYTKLLR
jgi:hypothetical protein